MRNCLLSHEMRASSFYCLNKLGETDELSVSSHRGALYGLGFIAALVCAATMLTLSHRIFTSYTSYLNILIEGR